VPAVSTIWRILSRRGFVAPQPQKRPRSSWKMFCADQPNERWQADITHWGLADGAEVEILNILDDHSRLCLATGCPADHQRAATRSPASAASATISYAFHDQLKVGNDLFSMIVTERH
jgi:transposase InsO family protein